MERFKRICKELMRTPSKNKKVWILEKYMKNMDLEERWALAKLILSQINGYSLSVVKNAIGDFTPYYRGDTYEAVRNHLSRRKYTQRTLEPQALSLLNVVKSLLNAPKDNRASILGGIISILDEETASFLIASLLGDLQVGVGEGLFLEALSRVEGVKYEELKKRVYTLGWDSLLKKGEAALRPTIPFRPMLAEKAISLEEIIKEGNYWVEPKLDGIRILVHREGEKTKVFSRRGKDITNQFPEIVEYVSQLKGNLILDGEVIALKGNKILPFQNIMRRFSERKNVSIDFYFFDIVYYDVPLINEPYIKRRAILEDLLDKTLSRIEIRDPEVLKEKFEEYVSRGYEGIVCKKGEGLYHVGERTKEWLKYKRTFEVDAVIVAAEWGHGKRRKWLSDYHLALWDDGKLVEVGKTFKGLTNLEMEKITKILLSLKKGTIPGGIVVEPRIVVEVEFEDVQISPKYEKYTLRFARIKRIREDKRPEDAGKIEEVEKIYRYLHGSF